MRPAVRSPSCRPLRPERRPGWSSPRGRFSPRPVPSAGCRTTPPRRPRPEGVGRPRRALLARAVLLAVLVVLAALLAGLVGLVLLGVALLARPFVAVFVFGAAL